VVKKTSCCSLFLELGDSFMQSGFFAGGFVGVNYFVTGGAVDNALGFKEGGLGCFFVFGCNYGL